MLMAFSKRLNFNNGTEIKPDGAFQQAASGDPGTVTQHLLTVTSLYQAERGKPSQRVGEEKASILDGQATTRPLSGAHPAIINRQEPLRSRRHNCDPNWTFQTLGSRVQQNSGAHDGRMATVSDVPKHY